jgi:metallo-beta-lactamase family protein
VKIQFLGASQQVTGSCYLFEAAGLRLLVDCGLFQERPYLARNWDPFPVPPETIDLVLLTHVHLDHCGGLPKLVREGFSGDILTTSASAELLSLVLMDAARIQEEDAAFKKKRHQKEGRKGAHPETPLFTVEDVQQTLPQVEETAYSTPVSLNDDLQVVFHDAGHILGSAMLELMVRENGAIRRVLFSGDIGQWGKPLLKDPSIFKQADYLVMESTYGDRDHKDPNDIETMLSLIINRTVQTGGNVVIPTFAVERAQELIFYLNRLNRARRIPNLRSFLDSPMAISITDVFEHHPECLDQETLALIKRGERPFDLPGLRLVRRIEESKSINSIKGSCLIMSGSGMCTGGRIKHHLVRNISRPDSTVLFVGYQARDTLGRQILEGNSQVRIFGEFHPVRAKIDQIHGFSAHADQGTLVGWLDHFDSPPRRVFLTHAEEETASSFSLKLRESLGWEVTVPRYREIWDLE